MPDSTETEQPSRPITRWWRWIVIAFVLMLVLGIGVISFPPAEPPFLNDIAFTKTTYPTGMPAPSSSLISKVMYRYLEFRQRHYPNPSNWTFPIAATNRCSVHGLLNQCMEITGNRYFIEKNAAAGSVNFGSTHVQNGAQWVNSFQRTLQSGQPEWWDSERQGFRHENLVLLRYDDRTILVLSEATAKSYLQKYPALKRMENPAPDSSQVNNSRHD